MLEVDCGGGQATGERGAIAALRASRTRKLDISDVIGCWFGLRVNIRGRGEGVGQGKEEWEDSSEEHCEDEER